MSLALLAAAVLFFSGAVSQARASGGGVCNGGHLIVKVNTTECDYYDGEGGTFTVPSGVGVTNLHVVATGGTGQNGENGATFDAISCVPYTSVGGAGGPGDIVSGDVSVTPSGQWNSSVAEGDQLQVNVGTGAYAGGAGGHGRHTYISQCYPEYLVNAPVVSGNGGAGGDAVAIIDTSAPSGSRLDVVAAGGGGGGGGGSSKDYGGGFTAGYPGGVGGNQQRQSYPPGHGSGFSPDGEDIHETTNGVTSGGVHASCTDASSAPTTGGCAGQTPDNNPLIWTAWAGAGGGGGGAGVQGGGGGGGGSETFDLLGDATVVSEAGAGGGAGTNRLGPFSTQRGPNNVPASLSISWTSPTPSAGIALNPSTPDGSNGWYVHQPQVSVSGAEASTSIPTQCLLDPATPPSSWVNTWVACSDSSIVSKEAKDGAHTVYAVAVDIPGGKTSPIVSRSWKVDRTAPQITFTFDATPQNPDGTYPSDYARNVCATETGSGFDPATTTPVLNLSTGCVWQTVTYVPGATGTTPPVTIYDLAGNKTTEAGASIRFAKKPTADPVHLSGQCGGVLLPCSHLNVQEGGTVDLAGYIDASTDTFGTLTIDWGDGSTTQASYPCAPGAPSCPFHNVISPTGPEIQFAFSHTYPNNPHGGSTYTITATNSEASAAVSDAIATTSATVTNVAPSLTLEPNCALCIYPPGSTLTADAGTPIQLAGQVTDPGTDTGTVTIHWGDGSTPTTVPFDCATSGEVCPTPSQQNLSCSLLLSTTPQCGFFFKPHTYAYSGTYTINATATDQDGASSTQTTTATITRPPFVQTQPLDQHVLDSTQVSFTSTAGGAPSPTEQWQVSTDGGNTFTNISNETSTTLSLTAVVAKSGNEYRAVFTNPSGSTPSNAATLTVGIPPTVTTQPNDQTVTDGQTATFTTAASGFPAPTVQWLVSTNGATFTPIPGATSTTLSFTASLSQSGNAYTAIFHNSAPGGNAHTNIVTLTVKSNQTITVTTHAPASKAYGGQFTVAATGGGSGNPVTYSSSGACSNSSATFTMTSASGTCSVKYDQAGNASYNPATEVTETVTASKADQAITVTTHAPASWGVGGSPFSVSAVGGGSGNPIQYGSSGVCTNSGAAFTMTSGSGTCTVKYDQAGNANYNAAPEATELVTANSAPIVSPAAAPPAEVGVPWTASFQVSGGTQPYSFTPNPATDFAAQGTGITPTITWNSSTSTETFSGTATTTGRALLAVNGQDHSGTLISLQNVPVDVLSLTTTPGPTLTYGNGASLTASVQILQQGFSPNGTLTFKLLDSSNNVLSSANVTANGNGSYAAPNAQLPPAVGTYTWKVSYSNAAGSIAAAPVTEAVNAKTNQTITVTTHAPSSAAYDDEFIVDATGGGSGRPVTFSSDGACLNSGNIFVMQSSSGTCYVKYDQAGTATYNAATEVVETVTATLGNQAITVTTHAPSSAAYNTQFTVAATGNAAGPFGVSYWSAGSCTNIGSTFTMTSGTGTCRVTYKQPGAINFNPAPDVTETVTATKVNQAITVTTPAPSSAAYNAQFAVAATGGGSNNPITYSSGGACLNSGNILVMQSSSGTCSVKYDQAGNANYNAATEVTEAVSASKANQAITVTTHAPSSAAYSMQFSVAATGGDSGSPIQYGSSGACSHTGATFTMTSATGTCTVTYDQAGNANYNAASETTETVTATPATQTIHVTIPAPASAAYTAQFTVAATGGGSGASVTYSSSGGCSNNGSTLTMTSATAACKVMFDQAGDSNYTAAPEITEMVTASKQDQSIMVTSPAPASAVYGTGFTVAATGGASGNAIVYGSSGGCSHTGAHFTITSGSVDCIVMYDETGNSNYNAAAQKTETVSVGKAALSITPNNRSKYYDQALTLGTTAFSSSGLVGSDSVFGVTLTSTGAQASAASGNYPITAGSAAAGSGTNLGNYAITYHSGTLTVSPVGLIGLNGVSVTATKGKIDSFDSTHGAYSSSNHGSTALVMSNAALSFGGVSLLGGTVSTIGSVKVASSASVSGNVAAGTTVANSGTVSGTVTQHSPSKPLSVPAVKACSPLSAKTGISGGTFTFSSGNLLVKSGTVKLATKTYCFNNVTINSGAKLSVTGAVTINLKGRLSAKGQIVNTTKLPGRLHIVSSYSGSAGVAIVGGNNAAMTILAPKTSVSIAGGSFFGTVLAGTVNLTGSVSFHADQH